MRLHTHTYLQYDFLVREKIADGALIAKWRKPGYEILCSMLAIQRGSHNFGTTSHCRVPMKKRAQSQRITPDVQTGCICCASGNGKFGGPIWWNTPLDDEDDEEGGDDKKKKNKETAEQNRAVWVQEGVEDEEDGGGDDKNEGEGEDPQVAAAAASRKRPLEVAAIQDDEDELEDDVKKRLAALRQQ